MKPWWQRNCMQGRAEVLLLWALVLVVAMFFLFLAVGAWAQTGCVMQTIILPDGRMVVCQVCPGLTTCF